MPPIASQSSHQPLVSTQNLDTGSDVWTYLLSGLFAILFCLFGLCGVWLFQGPRIRRRHRRDSDVELGTGATTTALGTVRKPPTQDPGRHPAAVWDASRRLRIPRWPPRSRAEAQAFLARRAAPLRFPSETLPVGGEPCRGTTAGVRRRRRNAVVSLRE